MTQISFKAAEEICQALGKFAQARNGSKPNKDIILIVEKIEGRKTLQTTELSKMKWYNRLIRYFGLGNATLKAVATFLQENEPYLPQSFSEFKKKDILDCHYDKKDVETLLTIQKERYTLLRKDKISGCKAFQQCLSHHNSKSKRKIPLILLRTSALNLQTSGTINGVDISPKPLGILPNEENTVQENFYVYTIKDIKNQNILGFCHEYGLGTPVDLEKAFAAYKSAPLTDYAAQFNLGRLYLQKNNPINAITSFSQAENLLVQEIEQKLKELEDLNADKEIKSQDPKLLQHYQEVMEKRKADKKSDLKVLRKALSKTYLALAEAHKQNNGPAEQEKYSKLASDIKSKYPL